MLRLVPQQGKVIFLPNIVSLAGGVHNYVNVQSSRDWIKVCELLVVHETLESRTLLVTGVHMASYSKGFLTENEEPL